MQTTSASCSFAHSKKPRRTAERMPLAFKVITRIAVPALPQDFAEFDEALRLAEPASGVGGYGSLVPRLGVGGQFGEAALAGPVLGRLDQGSANALSARERLDVPALDVGHRHRFAAVRERPHGEFEESYSGRLLFGDEDRGNRRNRFAGREVVRFGGQLAGVGGAPEPGAKERPAVGIVPAREANQH